MASTSPTKPSKAFLDSSALFAGAVSAKGYARDVLLLSARRSVFLYASSVVWQETERNVRRKSAHGLPYLSGLRAAGIIGVVDPPESLIREVSTVVVDKDAPIVAAAITADVDWLVTYDRKHLLRQARVIYAGYGIAVVTPDEVVRRL